MLILRIHSTLEILSIVAFDTWKVNNSITWRLIEKEYAHLTLEETSSVQDYDHSTLDRSIF